MEWNGGNFKKFKELFKIKESGSLTVDQRHILLVKIKVAQFLHYHKQYKNESLSSNSEIKFSSNFNDDLRNYCLKSFLFIEDSDIENIFGTDYNPYSDINDAIDIADRSVRSQENFAGSKKAPHPPHSITWYQFYTEHMKKEGKNSGLLKLYNKFFRSNYKLSEEKTKYVSNLLFKKCMLSAIARGRDLAINSHDDNSSGEIKNRGINLLIAKHEERSDLAMGEKKAVMNIMKTFCLAPNEFRISKECVKRTLFLNLNDIIPEISSNEYHSISSEQINIGDFSTNLGINKLCNQEELDLIKKILKSKKNINEIGEDDYNDLDISNDISKEDYDKFIKNKYTVYYGVHSAIAHSEVSLLDLENMLNEYYDQDVIKEYTDDHPDEHSAWAITINELSSEIASKCFPMEKNAGAYTDTISQISKIISKNISSNYKIEDEIYIVKN